MSLFRWNMGDPAAQPVFVGMKNFITVWGEENFTVSLTNSFIFSFVTVALCFVLGLWFAVLLSQEFKGASIFRSIFLESLMLVVIGALASIIPAYYGSLILEDMVTASLGIDLPLLSFDTGSIGAALLVIIVAGSLASIYPAWLAMRMNVVEALREVR